MTLADFLPTPETAAAWTAIGELAENVAADRPFDPGVLFLHGPPGTGKTHLVQGLKDTATAAGRTAELTAAADLARLPDPTHGDRRCDLWIVEDLQHLAERAAAPLDRIMEIRQCNRKATVITARSGPAHLNLPPRLLNRVSGGLVIGLALPSVASRRALLQHLAPPGLRVQPLALDWLAKHLTGVRTLHGAMQTLIGLAADSKMPLDRTAVQKHWAADPSVAMPTLETVLKTVAAYFNMDPKVLKANDRRPGRTWPTQMVLALARKLTGASAVEVGQFFDGREARTVLYACKAVDTKIAKDPVAAGDWEKLITQFGVSMG